MRTRDLLIDAATRPAGSAVGILRDLSPEAAHVRPAGGGNSIAWLLWHAARQMDAQTAALSGEDTVWQAGGWAERLGVHRDPDDFGLGDDDEAVAALHVDDVPALGDHLSACTEAFIRYVCGLDEADLDEIVDDSYDPPVSRGVRLVSIVHDAVAHVGQAAYVRGLTDGWRHPA